MPGCVTVRGRRSHVATVAGADLFTIAPHDAANDTIETTDRVNQFEAGEFRCATVAVA